MERSKLSIVASAMALFGAEQNRQDLGWSVFDQMQRVANKAKTKGERISQPSAPSYEMQRKTNKENGLHSMRCQFRIKGNEIMANGKHRFYMKNGEIVDRLGQ